MNRGMRPFVCWRGPVRSLFGAIPVRELRAEGIEKMYWITAPQQTAGSEGVRRESSAPKLRVLFLIDEIGSLDGGGTERQVLQMIRLLRRLGHEPSLAVLRGTEWLTAEEAGCPVYSARARSLFGPSGWRGCYKLVRRMRRERVDLLQTFFVESNIVGPWLARLAGVPVVVGTQRNLDPGKSLVRWARRWTSQWVDRVIVNSQGVWDMMVATRGVASYKLRVAYNGIDLTEFSGLPSLRTEMRRSLGIEENEILVGNVSVMRPIKGLVPFVEAVKLAVRKDQTLRFVLVGGGDQMPLVAELIRQYGLENHVRMAGPQTDVLPYLAAMDIGVLSSLAEGFSNSLLEYMASGLPVVATDVGGNREALGDTGILVPPNDPSAIAEAILDLRSTGLRRRLGQAAQHRVERFSLEQAERRMEEIYEDCFAAKGARLRRNVDMEETGKARKGSEE